MSKWRFWIDSGGTFTDVIGVSSDGYIQSHKLLSKNELFYKEAVLEGIRRILGISSTMPIPYEKITEVYIGTTVATNALLQRKGKPVVLITNRGFKDQLRIAYQDRPYLFSLHVQRKEPLYQEVIEIKGRISHSGKILEKLDTRTIHKELHKLKEKGINSIAIVLMHSYKYIEHEKQIYAMACDMGFDNISVSHQVTATIKYIERGNATVIDAYLNPILNQYKQNILDELKGVKVFFMRSDGGLVEPAFFQGRDSILSGPAGGVVGMVKTSQKYDFNQVIGFDMGGTSTDLSYYHGQYEKVDRLFVDDICMSVPAMDIHTIAAGGGSILHFKHGRFMVGPDSAESTPGPACYGKGGPLTITDANVVLGRIHPEYMPHVFGKDAQQPLNKNLAQNQFEKLSKQVTKDTNYTYTPEQVAEGFINIAIENMSNAIKRISMERGHDLRQCVINAFGGAAGQHVCLLAEYLNVNKIIIHALSGLLSAYGIGHADISASVIKTILIEMNDNISMSELWRELYQEAKEKLVKQGFTPTNVSYTIHCRYIGTDKTIPIVWSQDYTQCRKAYHNKYYQKYGYNYPSRAIEIVNIQVDVWVDRTTSYKDMKIKPTKTADETLHYKKLFYRNKWYTCPVWMYHSVKEIRHFEGPFIIQEKNSTLFIPPHWRISIDTQGNAICTYQKTTFDKKAQIPKRKQNYADAVELEIFYRKLTNIAENMGIQLANTAASVNIRERLDYSCAIFDSHTQLIANAPHIPVHLGSMSESVRAIVKHYGNALQRDHVYMLNDPYTGGTHLPDITVVMPIYGTDKSITPCFFVAARGHHADIGGITPGSMPAHSHTIDEEGVLIKPICIVEKNKLRENILYQLLTNNKYPARNIQQNMVDISAQIAALQLGKQQIKILIEQFGVNYMCRYSTFLLENTAEHVRKYLKNIKKGHGVCELDHGQKIYVQVSFNNNNQRLNVDFSKTSPQRDNNFNAPLSITKAVVLYVMKCMLKEPFPLNDGYLKYVDIDVPAGCMLNPKYPSAVAAGNVETSQLIADALMEALKLLANSQGTMNNFTFGSDRYQYYETIAGGVGAGVSFSGCDAIHSHMTNSRLTDPEVLEERFPIVLEECSIRKHSGGQGKYKGGDGMCRQYRFMEDMQCAILSGRRKIAPKGMMNGGNGMKGNNWLIQKENKKRLDGCTEISIKSGDSIRIETPGGGGWGK